MDKMKFLSASLSNVSQVYSGKQYCCRCGCKGKYTATSFMKNPRTEDINDKLVEKRLKRAQRLVEAGAAVEYGDTWVDVTTGNDRSLTFYFDELKAAKYGIK